MQNRQPILFLSHGSPMTAQGGDELNRTWRTLAATLTRPDAILMVSAHWNTRVPLIGASPRPETIHDFGGFPAELYQLHYPAPGAPALAREIQQQLNEAGLPAELDAKRGLDHGAWVPLRTLFPEADIPVIPLSVQPGLNARHHEALGKALSPLADRNILIVASGHMTHNLRDYMLPSSGERPAPATRAFREWVHTQLTSGQYTALLDWEQMPGARFAHPTPEHFLPLFVALGAAGDGARVEWLGGGWIEESLAADHYRFD